MAIPDYQSIMLPLLQYMADGEERSLRETIDHLGSRFGLTEVERQVLLPSGRQPTFDNRVGWARTYLKKAGLLEATKRGHARITTQGMGVLSREPQQIDVALLMTFPEFVAFRNMKKKTSSTKADIAEETRTPEEQMEVAHQQLREELARELLEIILSCSPTFFEKLVVDLLLTMGYGGTRQDAGQAIGRSGDGGIDGIIKEDRLGLDIVYIQAKRWETSVSRPEVQKFAGALQGRKARKGIFITTSTFTSGAEEFVSVIDSKIVLIDGEQLSHLMIDFGLGVSSVAQYEINRVDLDYFADG